MWQKYHPAAMHEVYWESVMFSEVSRCDKAANLQNDDAYLLSAESNAVKPKWSKKWAAPATSSAGTRRD